jgi:hypothetical protein
MRGRYLYAHLPFDQALAFARQQPGQTIDETEFRAWWDAAQQRKAAREPAWRAPVERDLPAGCEAYVAEVTAIPQAMLMGARPWAIRIVDLRRVVGFQMNITEERITLPGDLLRDDPCAVLRFTLRTPNANDMTIVDNPTVNEYTISGVDPNTRVMAKIRGDAPLGPLLGFVVGTGLPWVQVVSLQGRHVLRDGYHRVVGLLRAGITEVPAAVISGVEVADIGIPQSGFFFPPDLVLGPQPPLVADFLDDGLSRAGPAPTQVKVIRIRTDEFFVPVSDAATDNQPA